MIKRFTSLLLLACAAYLPLAAQTQDVAPFMAPSQNSPTGSAQGNITNGGSIDPFTGIGNVTVPIFDYGICGLNLGVSLQYNTKGIQVDQTASVVGLGWSLNSGGYIQRTPQGIEDDIYIPQSHVSPNADGDLRGNFLQQQTSVGNDPYAPIKGEVDWQRDLFTATFAGRSFNFVVKGAGDWTVETDQGTTVKVEVLQNGNVINGFLPYGDSTSLNPISFRITDENGNIFLFSPGDYAFKTYNGTYTYQPYERWVLTQVTTYTGQTVHYNYTRQQIIYPVKQQEVDENDSLNQEITSVIDSTYYTGSSYSMINEIDYPNGTKVNFNLYPLYDQDGNSLRFDIQNLPPLKSVVVSNGYDQNTLNNQELDFNYSYFNTPVNGASNVTGSTQINYNDPNFKWAILSGLLAADGLNGTQCTAQMQNGMRLRLDKITKVGTDNSSEPYYSFSYNATPLPLRLSQQNDYYGYFNGATISAVPYHGVYHYLGINKHSAHLLGVPITYGIDKTPNPSYMVADILTDVTNGGGGNTHYEYEGNTGLIEIGYQLPPVGDVLEAYDGLRIKSITAFDGFSHDNDVTTTYTYANGYRYSPNLYTWYVKEYWEDPLTQPDSSWILLKAYTNNIVSPIISIRGSSHGYGQVTETKTSFTGEQLSATRYTYSGLIDVSHLIDDDKTSSYNNAAPPLFCDYNNIGLLTDIQQLNSSGQLLSEKQYQYQRATIPLDFDNWGNTYNFAFSVRGNFDSTYLDSTKEEVPGVDAYEWDYHLDTVVLLSILYGDYNKEGYSSLSIPPLLSSQTDITYSGDNVKSNTITYGYNADNTLHVQDRTDSRGYHYRTFYLYDGDYGLGNFYSPYLQHNFLLTQKIVKLLPFSSSGGTGPQQLNLGYDSLIIGCSTRSFDNTHGVPLFPSSYVLADNQPVGWIQDYLAVGNPPAVDNMFKTSEAEMWDDHYNVLQYQYKNQNLYSSAIWDTRIGKKIADVQNAQYSDIAYTSFEGTFQGQNDYNMGNWQFDPHSVAYANESAGDTAVTGHYYYNMQGGTTISSQALHAGIRYMLSFWATGGVGALIGGGNAIQLTDVLQIGVWHLYTGTFTGYNAPVTLASGYNNVKIDELRLYPAKASMTTYTYEPLFGPNSVTDDHMNTLHYKYDAMGRLNLVEDIHHNILSLKQYGIQSADN